MRGLDDDDVDQTKMPNNKISMHNKLLNHIIIEQSAATLLKMDLSQSIDSILIFTVVFVCILCYVEVKLPYNSRVNEVKEYSVLCFQVKINRT